MIQKTSGYRGMLRDRVPKVVDYALKWRKAKERWVEYAYSNLVKIVGEEFDEGKVLRTASESKKIIVRAILGIRKGKSKDFIFDRTINWEDISPEETEYWKSVSSWVNWFMSNYAYIENVYRVSRSCGKSEFDTKVEIIHDYLDFLMPRETDDEEMKQAKYKNTDNFVNYLIKCFNS